MLILLVIILIHVKAPLYYNSCYGIFSTSLTASPVESPVSPTVQVAETLLTRWKNLVRNAPPHNRFANDGLEVMKALKGEGLQAGEFWEFFVAWICREALALPIWSTINHDT
jgi:hypothetical protein